MRKSNQCFMEWDLCVYIYICFAISIYIYICVYVLCEENDPNTWMHPFSGANFPLVFKKGT